MMWLRMIRGLCCLAALGALAGGAGSQAGRAGLPASDAWQAADKLIAEQKFDAAATAVAAIRESARRARDHENWTLALVREVQLRMGLHGHETAVRFLREQPWPDDATSQLVLRLFYAQSLNQYARAYGHEIRGRTRVESAPGPTPNVVDLKTWTAEQIDAEANAAYATVWRDRAALGSQPRSRVERYLAPGNYPDSVRGSLRDLTAYLWVEHLADTSGWSAAQTNERYRLDLAALLAGDATGGAGVAAAGTAAGTAAAVDPSNPAAHPVQRLAAVLNDLRDWHASRHGARAGASVAARTAQLETQLELARRLSQVFTDAADRQAIVTDLDRRLAGARDIAWFAHGKALQAELMLALNQPVQAHTAARSGRDAFPAETGGQNCAALMAQIEAPEFSLLAMAADLPGKRSLRVTHRNLPRLHLRAYKLSLDARLAAHGAPLPDHHSVTDLLGKDGSQRAGLLAQWTVELPATPDFADHATDITPPLTQHGMVMIVASPSADFRSGGANRIAATPLLLTNLVLTTRPQPGHYEVQAFDAASGAALEGVEVRLYEYSPRAAVALLPRTPVATARTNAEGMALLAQPREQRGYFIAAQHAGVWALAAEYLNTPPEAQASAGASAFIYTDRSVYRPEQKLAFKIVAYRFNAASGGRGALTQHTLATEQDIDVQLLDANQQEVERRRVRTNSFGTASGEFSIPPGRLLGQWALRANNGHAAVRRGIQASDLRSDAERGRRALPPQSSGTHPRRRALLLRPAGDDRLSAVEREAHAGVSAVALLGPPPRRCERAGGGRRQRSARPARRLRVRVYARRRRTPEQPPPGRPKTVARPLGGRARSDRGRTYRPARRRELPLPGRGDRHRRRRRIAQRDARVPARVRERRGNPRCRGRLRSRRQPIAHQRLARRP